MRESGRLPAAGRRQRDVRAADEIAVSQPEAVSRARSRAWLARLCFALVAVAVAILIAFAGLRSIAMLGVALVSAAVSLAAAYWFLAERGIRRWLALAVLVLSPVAVIIVFAVRGLLWVALASAGAWLLAGLAARAALAPDPSDWRMPELRVDRAARHPFLIMNPRSGGGKVAKFDLKHKAEELGAQVFMVDGPGPADVEAVAERAVAEGADLLGVAGGDGTQALVAGVAANHGLPFVVITAGTRNHFALDLGLDRDDPAACLAALTDGVDLRVDLGAINGQTFVNNASFGAYAEIVESPQYREDKLNQPWTSCLTCSAASAGLFLRPRRRSAHRGSASVLDRQQSVRNGRRGWPRSPRPAGSRGARRRGRQRDTARGRRPACCVALGPAGYRPTSAARSSSTATRQTSASASTVNRSSYRGRCDAALDLVRSASGCLGSGQVSRRLTRGWTGRTCGSSRCRPDPGRPGERRLPAVR